MEHKFKVNQWVEWSDGIHLIYHIKGEGLWLTDENHSAGGVHMSSVKPLTLRPGDFCKTEGMSQEQFDRIVEAFMGDEYTLVDGEVSVDVAKGKKFIQALCLEYGNKNVVYTDHAAAGRELTLDQILSTLPEEVDTFKELVEATEEIGGYDWELITPKAKIDNALKAENPQDPATPKAQEIDWSKPYTTGEGMPCNIVHTSGVFNILEILDVGAGYNGHQFVVDMKGHAVSGDYYLINVPEEHTFAAWANVYKENGVNTIITYGSREVADSVNTEDRIACVSISITYTHGQGL